VVVVVTLAGNSLLLRKMRAQNKNEWKDGCGKPFFIASNRPTEAEDDRHKAVVGAVVAAAAVA
jgi:hypothetical protein